MISNEEYPNSSRSLTKLPADQIREIENYAYKVAGTLVCGILILTNGSWLLDDKEEYLVFLIVAFSVIVCGCWLTMTAAWAVLGFGKFWKWLLVTSFSVCSISLLNISPAFDDPKMIISSALMGCVLAFLICLPFYLGVFAILRWRNWRLIYEGPHSKGTAILEPQFRFSILDLMIATGIAAVTIAILSLCDRTLKENGTGMIFGPFFGVVIIVYVSITVIAVSLVTVVPSLIIGMNRRTTTKQKKFRLAIHLLLATLVAIGLCYRIRESWALMPLGIGIAVQACWSFLVLPRLTGFDKPGWLRFGLIRMSRPIKQVAFKV